MSRQLTEQPAQAPRGREGGALQELLWPSRSVPGGPVAGVLGGPVSLEGAAGGRSSFATHAASDSAMSTPAASDAPDRMLEGRVLTPTY